MKRKDSTGANKKDAQAQAGEGRGGYRSRRLESGRRDRRRRTAKIIIILGILLAAVSFAAVLLLFKEGPGERSAPAENLAPVAEEESGSGNVVMVRKNDAGGLAEVLVLTRSPDQGFQLFVVPARTVAEVGGLGFQRLDSLYETNGQQALDQALADLLQLPLQYHIVFASTAIETLTEQVGTLNLKTEAPLRLAAPAGAPSTTLPEGDNPSGFTTALTWWRAAADDRADGPSIQAVFWQGLRDAIAARPDADKRTLATRMASLVQTDLGRDGFVELFLATHAAASRYGVTVLPVESVGSGADWYFEPLVGDGEGLSTGASAAIEIEIQNGTERSRVVEEAAAALEPLGFATALRIEPSGVNFEVTQIRCGSEALSAAGRVRDALGAGTIIKDDFMEKEQIIVIIGKDYADGEVQPADENG